MGRMARVTVAPSTAEPSSGPERFEGAVLTIFMLVAIAAVGAFLYMLEQDALDDPAQKAARGEVTNTSELSLVRQPRLSRAIDAIAGKAPAGSVIVNLRIEAARVDAQVREPDNKRRILHVNPAFDVDEDDFGEGTDRGLPPDDVHVGAPERILTAAEKRYDFDREDLDYLVWSIDPIDETPGWSVFFTKRAPENHLLAAADGSDVRRPGEPDRKQRADQRRREREQAARERADARRLRCLQRADTAVEAARCTQ